MKRSLPLLLVGLLGFTANGASPAEPASLAQTNSSPEAVTNLPPLSVEASQFCEALAPYGDWYWLPRYGWVWMPSGVDVAWRPYTCGHWAYTDNGWTWASDFEWGWAPFHYGRWGWDAHHGWCWVPGDKWAPAWVAWHFSDTWCGWAPLPPLVKWETSPDWDALIPAHGWCFVADQDFCRRHLNDDIIVAARNVTLLHETKNVTRMEVRDGRVMNLSLSAGQIEKSIGRPVPRYIIVDAASAEAARAGRTKKGTIGFYRPVSSRSTAVSTARTFPPPRHRPSRPTAKGSQSEASSPNFEQLRRNEIEHRRLETSQAKRRAALERWHQRELAHPPPGLSPLELLQRHEAEHRAFLDQLSREEELFESRAQEEYNLVPYETEQPTPLHSPPDARSRFRNR